MTPLGHRPSLDGMRAVAVLMVVIVHTWPNLLPGGGIGVDVFFVLSGFLITTLLLEEHDRTGRVGLRHFYLRRALRLLPALAATVVVAFVLSLLLVPDRAASTAREALAAELYVSNWLEAMTPSVQHGALAHTWSLAIEEQFYLVWPVILLAVTRVGGRRLALAAVVTGAAVILVDRTALWTGGGRGAESLYFRSDTHSDGLLIGCAIALASVTGTLRRLPPLVVDAACTAGAGFLAVCAAGLGRGAPSWASMYTWGLSAVALAAGACIVGVLLRPGGVITRGLSAPLLVAIGRRSYGAYLWHYPLWFLLVRPHLPQGAQAFLITLLLTLVIAWVSFRWLETPFLRIRERTGPRCPTRDAPVVVAA
jgi:peptidoglycan/LPS O-acetylase OafA/YrhL